MRTDEKTVRTLYICVAGYIVFVAIIATILTIANVIAIKQLLLFLLGLIAGGIVVYFWVKSIHQTVEIGLELGEEDASKYMKKHSIIRMVIIIAILIVGAYFSLNIIIGTMIGLMGLKIAAYLQIITNKKNTAKDKNTKE